MVFPISRAHQQATADGSLRRWKQNICPIIHLVKFPALTINHGMIVFDAGETEAGTEFSAYDPNDPAAPACLHFDRARKTFSLPPQSLLGRRRVGHH